MMINAEHTLPETAADRSVAEVRRTRLALESFFSHDWKKLNAIIEQLEHNHMDSPTGEVTSSDASALPSARRLGGDCSPNVEQKPDGDEGMTPLHTFATAEDSDRLARLAKAIEQRIKTTSVAG